ncbi:GGDEF domain-containing protein [Aestuariicella sp. G3-2]|uniref:GGDEF domain-containing protein n=1 Tax=Pseudomaricurvus albidus TaxID=2842452 RepID=UPI001C0CC3F8|nr:GGDEF domain-containing protein [Aestuariicella albida]
MDSQQNNPRISDIQAVLARPYRKSVLKVLLVITMVSGFLFAGLNIQRGNISVAVVELVMAGYSLAILCLIPRVKNLESWILAYVLPFFSAMMVALLSPSSTASVFVWSLLIPMVAHLLLGRRKGLAVSVVFIAVAVVIYFFKFRNNMVLMQPVAVANVAILTLVILALSHVYEITREQTEARLLNLAHSDPLTGLANRARLRDVFAHEKVRSQRSGTPLSLVVFDLDHFKRVNDSFGHESGDLALKHFSQLLKQSLRKTDLAVRLGGEEFCMLLMDTSPAQAMMVAEKIRLKLEQSSLEVAGGTVKLTLSAGVAGYGEDGDALEDVLRAADLRLYTAKKDGRNRVCLKEPDQVCDPFDRVDQETVT